MTTLPAWLPAVIAGGLVAAAGWMVVGVASAAVDWRDARRLKRAQGAEPSDPRTQPPNRSINFPYTRKGPS